MSEELLKHLEDFIRSSKTNRVSRLNYAKNLLTQEARPLFLSEQKNGQPKVEVSGKIPTSGNKRVNMKTLSEQEKLLMIIEEFIDEFEERSLPQMVSVKNYLLFLLIVLKILRKVKQGYHRGLHSANTLSRLNQMFAKYPVDYNKRSTRDPLGLLLIVTELILEAGRGLGFPYKLDETTSYQFVPLVTKYVLDSEDPLQELIADMSDMPKFRLPVIIDDNHKEIIAKIFGHCLSKLPIKLRVEKTSKLLEKITLEKNDSLSLAHYKTLKLFFEKDNEIRTHLSKIAKEPRYQTGHRTFVKGIIEELAGLGNVS